MKKFLLFVGGLVAFFVLLVNLGPMLILGISVWLLYLVFKKFVQSESTGGKIGWFIVGLLIFSISLSNIYALLGVVAIMALYYIYKSWKEDSDSIVFEEKKTDPFTNFEGEWAELNK